MVNKLFESSLIKSIQYYEVFPKPFGTDVFPSNTVVFPYADEWVKYKKGVFGRFVEVESSIINYYDAISYGHNSYCYATHNPKWDIEVWNRIQTEAKLWTSPDAVQIVNQFCKKHGLNLCYDKKPILYKRTGHGRYNTLNEYLKDHLHHNKAIFRHFICISTTNKSIDEIYREYYDSLVDELMKEDGRFYYHLMKSSKMETLSSWMKKIFCDYPVSGGNIEVSISCFGGLDVKYRESFLARYNFSELGWENLASDYERFWLGYSLLETIVEELKKRDITININTFEIDYREDVSVRFKLPVPIQDMTPPRLEPW